MTRPATTPESGLALLIVLLVVAVIAGLGLAITDDVRFAVRRTANLRAGAQAQWFALGAEALARDVLWASRRANPARTTLNDAWAREDLLFPIEGGAIATHLTDAGNCFNLNSIVERAADGRLAASESGMARYRALLTALEIETDRAEELAATLTDWIDPDTVTMPRGAEDATYASLDPPYRTGNTLLADVSELRAIAGYSELLFRRVQPFVCALPRAEPTPLNINTLTEEQAPLLTMLLGQKLRAYEARRAIAGRPPAGFATLDDFWAQEVLAGIEAGDEVRRQLSLTSRYFRLDSRIEYHSIQFAMSSLLEIDGTGAVKTLTRQQGAVE